ncbi:MAG: T9SS type A sorting domain-containing protein, partial [Lewinella sp.]|nr:T9SS type A sorting domain-containing protein [Lewinella sp.]
YNSSEFSYLLSPCLDFSTLAEDPSLSFSLFFDSESCCDEGWVEVSTDGGESWTKVGTSGTGVNWYNDSGNNWWDGTGNFTGWVTAKNILTGTAGEPNVNLRFVMSTDGSVVREGMGIDNVFITTPLDIDLAASSPSHTADEECGDPEDMLTVTITNAGQSPQSGFNVSYQVNGGDIITEMVSDTVTLDPDESYDYTFLTTLDASAFIDYDIIFWADQPGDGFLINDTTYLSFSIAPAELPYAENFESMAIPADWTVDADLFVNNGHNNTSYVLSDNMFSGDQSFSATMPVLGPVEATDTLYFDYRYTNWSAGTEATVLSENDIFTVLVSTDCGETYTALYVINSANHVPTAEMTTVAVSLADFAGQYIRIQFSAIYGEGDYWLDLDNIFIPRCPPSLELTSEVTDASGPDIADGAVTVTPAAGAGPYQYFWSNGTTDPALTGVLPGDYNVVVVDAFGCTDVIDVTVDFMVSTDNLTETFGEVTLAPNPSAGMANLSVTFNETVDARVSVHNMLGQQAWQAAPQRGVRQLNETIDLQNWPAGIYLVRVQANDQVKVVKLVKQ